MTPRKTRIIVVGLSVLVAVLLGVVIYVVINFGAQTSTASSEALTAAQGAQRASGQALNADTRAAAAARDAKRGLANFKKLSAERRAQNLQRIRQLRGETAANHALTVSLQRLSDQRNADNLARIQRETALSQANRQEVIALSSAQAALAIAQHRIAELTLQQRHASRKAEHDTCKQVEAVKTALRFTLTTVSARRKLTGRQQAELNRILARFKARKCPKA